MTRKTINVILALVVFGLISCSNGGDRNRSDTATAEGAKPEIYFVELSHDFGVIKEGEKVAHLFRFENRGEADLLINSVTTSCGCTIPRFSEEPVSPGGTGTIEVVFDSSFREGKQTKSITVRSNADVPVMMLRITADIVRE